MFKIKEIKRISSKNKNVSCRLYSKSKSKNYFSVSKTNNYNNELSSLDNIIKIIIDVQISKSRKYKFEFLSNQDPVILTQKFILNNELFDISEFKKKDIFEQINNEIKKYNNNSRLFLSQINN